MKPYKTVCIGVGYGRASAVLPARSAKWTAAAPAMRSGGRRVSRIRDPGRGQPPFPKGGKGLALEAGTVVRALFITIDSKL